MPRSLLSAPILIGLFACGRPDQTIDIVFDPCEPLAITTDSTASSDRTSIEEALRLWNDLAQTRWSLSDSDAGDLMITFEQALPAQLGLYDDERGVIIMNRSLEAGPALTITIAHELGHSMGLTHVKDGQSVMIPANTSTPPSDADLDALVALWGACSP